MTTWISILISAMAVSVAIFFGLKSSRRDDSKDIEERAKNNATINVKLDNISNTVKDIKYDITATREKVDTIDKRLVVVEQSTKSAHHRIDRLEGKDAD